MHNIFSNGAPLRSASCPCILLYACTPQGILFATHSNDCMAYQYGVDDPNLAERKCCFARTTEPARPPEQLTVSSAAQGPQTSSFEKPGAQKASQSQDRPPVNSRSARVSQHWVAQEQAAVRLSARFYSPIPPVLVSAVVAV